MATFRPYDDADRAPAVADRFPYESQDEVEEQNYHATAGRPSNSSGDLLLDHSVPAVHSDATSSILDSPAIVASQLQPATHYVTTSPYTTEASVPSDVVSYETTAIMTDQFTTEADEAEADYDYRADIDSAYGGDSLLEDDTTSLRSFITDYVYENGRRYHRYKDGAYWGPNDERAADIIDYAHHIYLITLDQKLHMAPLQDPQHILDVGTGTGIWAIEMAELYPAATVVGTDLSAIQPLMVPPNCRFEVDDACLDWTFQTDSFDYVHVRELFGCIPDWDFFFNEAYKCIKPGGWIEVVEHSVEPISDDGTVDENHFFTEWGRTVMEMGKLNGKTFGIWRDSKRKLESAGFVDVVEVEYKWPMNGWSSDSKLHEIGRWNQVRLHHGVEGFMLRLLTNVGGWSPNVAQVFLSQMRKALKDYSTHAYLPGTVVYARKPLL